MATMNSRAGLNLWLAAMISLLVMCKSAMRSDAMFSINEEDTTMQMMQKLPNLTGYEAHFPTIIPDLRAFLDIQRSKQPKLCVGSRSGNQKRKIQLHRSEQAKRWYWRSSNVSTDGLHILDLKNNWKASVRVWDRAEKQIDVVLKPGDSWTQELVRYKTKRLKWIISLQGGDQHRTVNIRKDPFGGILNPGNRIPMIKGLMEALPSRFIRLSKWVFSPEIGALAMIYVQVHPENKNKVAKLLLLHLPREDFRLQLHGYVRNDAFFYWVYQTPTNLVPLNQVNLQQLVFSMNSLANINKIVINQTSNETAGYLEKLRV